VIRAPVCAVNEFVTASFVNELLVIPQTRFAKYSSNRNFHLPFARSRSSRFRLHSSFVHLLRIRLPRSPLARSRSMRWTATNFVPSVWTTITSSSSIAPAFSTVLSPAMMLPCLSSTIERPAPKLRREFSIICWPGSVPLFALRESGVNVPILRVSTPLWTLLGADLALILVVFFNVSFSFNTGA
jgi:hypothetical protein